MSIANEVTKLVHPTEPVNAFTIDSRKVERLVRQSTKGIDVMGAVDKLRKEYPDALITVTHDEVIMIVPRYGGRNR